MKRLFLLSIVLLLSALNYAQDSIGIYAVYPEQVYKLEAINYSATKIKSSIVRAKTELEFDGKTSSNHFQGAATFRVYFGIPDASLVSKYYMFVPSRSIKDFGIGKFKVKKDSRRIATATIRTFGTSTIGGNETDDVILETRKIKENVYEITVIGKPGEYCIMPLVNGVGGYAGIYDFTID